MRGARDAAFALLSAAAAGAAGGAGAAEVARVGRALIEAGLSRAATEPPPLLPPALLDALGHLAPLLPREWLAQALSLIVPRALAAAQAADGEGGKAAAAAMLGLLRRVASHSGALSFAGDCRRRREPMGARAAGAAERRRRCGRRQQRRRRRALPAALRAAHARARGGGLDAAAAAALMPSMRLALAALPAAADVRDLCAALHADTAGAFALAAAGEARVELHARVLGLSAADLHRLGEEESDAANAENELFGLDGA